MTCKEIEKNLPAYLEDALSPREKAIVEGHLSSCARCSNALQDLKQTDKLVRELEEVEPPPWFKQKIMSQVREEAKEKESIFRKFFYPLHIKIPIQALATVLIAVIAFQIYRFGELEMKMAVSPPASVLKAEQEQAPGVAQKPAGTTPLRAEEGSHKEEKLKDIGKVSAPSSPEGGAMRRQTEAPVQKAETPLTEMPAQTAKKQEYLIKKDGELIGISASVKERAAAKGLPAAALEYKREMPGENAGAVTESRDSYAAPAATQALGTAMGKAVHIGVVVHVGDVSAAAGEVEKLLSRFEARNTRKQFLESSVILTAEIRAQGAAEFLKKLKAIGKTEGRDVPADTPGRYISIMIELKK